MNRGSAIIFGIAGQDGAYLRDTLEREKIGVIGVSRSAGNWIQGSVGERAFVERLIAEHQPRYVFHLAANSTTQHQALFENHDTISTGTLNILETVYRHHPETKVFIAGSGLQFENKGEPIDESAAFVASSPYAVARIQSVYAARYYRRLGLKTYIGYLFNHDSPHRSERHMTQRIARAACRIAAGTDEVLQIGNLSVRKEYTFAGDVVQAIWTLVNNECGVFECVIGSGMAYSIEDWIRLCFGRFNLSWEGRVVERPGFQAEYNLLVSNPSLIRSLGWEPQVDIEKLADLMLQ